VNAPGPPTSKVHVHYHRPPDRTDIFVQELIHDDGRVKVTLARDIRLPAPLVISGEIALEDGSDAVWFTFPGAWHDIGRFHRADGRLTGIYADIIVPCVFEPGGTWHTTDLFLDLWIPAREGAWDPAASPLPVVLDADELERAELAGWVSAAEAARAREEAERLMAAARAGAWPPAAVGEWTRARALDALRALS
jgi:predicted RNA-binding protein associated with RNAse of E/G family